MNIKCISIEPLGEEVIHNVKMQCGVDIKVIPREEWKDYRNEIIKCNILICRDRDLTKPFLDEFLALELIYIVSAGVEKVPFLYLKERGIKVVNSGGTSDSVMSEYVIGAMLLFSSKFKICIENKQYKHWERFLKTESLSDQKLLIVGTGKIGRAIARKAKMLEMVVWGVKRTKTELPEFDEVFSLQELEQLLPKVDYVVCILPLTDETIYLFNKNKFACMNENVVFINISRGKIVNENDLIEALENRTIKAAVLDVFETEPLSKDSRLWELDNVVITPHSSGRIENFMAKSMKIFSDNMRCYFEHKEIPNLVDLDKGY